MAVTVQLYNNAIKRLLAGEITIANLKFMLRSVNTFDATDDTIGDLPGSEVHGNGWSEGGESIGNAAWTVDNTNEAKLDGNDISVTVSGSALSAPAGVIYSDDSNDYLLALVDFGETKSADPGTDFKVNWHADGIIRVRLAD